jgi:hypothetical protein
MTTAHAHDRVFEPHALLTYIDHHNHHRPHRALDLGAPRSAAAPTLLEPPKRPNVDRRDCLGGLIHECQLGA